MFEPQVAIIGGGLSGGKYIEVDVQSSWGGFKHVFLFTEFDV